MYRLYGEKKRSFFNKLGSFTGTFVIVAQMLLLAALSMSVAGPYANAATSFSNDFESGTTGWSDYAGSVISQVSSGTNGVTSLSGSNHAEISEGNLVSGGSYDGKRFGPFTSLGGYESEFPFGGYTVSQSIYIDVSEADGSTDKRFDLSAATNNSAGSHRRDFIIHAGTNPTQAGEWCIYASNNAPGNPCSAGKVAITTTGWYTFLFEFNNVGGQLSVDMSVLDQSSAVVGSWNRTNASDQIGSTVGGHRYLWFATNDFDGLAIDDTELSGAPARAESEIDVYGDTSAGENQPGWLFNRDLNNATPIEFNTDTAALGNGSLYVKPLSSIASKKFIGEYFAFQDISELESFSYDFKVGSGGNEVTDANEFYLNVYANFDGTAATKYYDCKYDVVLTASSDWTTVTFDPTQSYPVTKASQAWNQPWPASCPAVPADMGAGATIRMFAINMGDTTAGDKDLDGYFDKVVVKTLTDITTYDFEPDVTAPTTVFTSPTNNAPVNSTNVTGTIADNLNVAQYSFNISGPANWSTKKWTPNTKEVVFDVNLCEEDRLNACDETTLPEGTYKVRVAAYDGSGNRDISTNVSFVYDKTAPTVTVKANSVGTEPDFSKVSFKLFDANKIDKVTVNGVEKNLSNNNWSDLNNVKPGVFGAVEGENTLVVYDVAGNTTTYEFTLDVTAPTISWQLQPLPSYSKNDGFHVRPITSEVGTVKSVYINAVAPENLCYEKNSDHKNMDTKNTQCQALWDNLPDGTHTFVAVFTDYAGNSTTSDSNEFILDTVKPSISNLYPASGNLVKGLVTVTADIQDINLEAYCVLIRVSPGSPSAAGNCANPSDAGWTNVPSGITNYAVNYDWNSVGEPEQSTYQFAVWARDVAGNIREVKSSNVVVDNSGPNVDGVVLNGQSVAPGHVRSANCEAVVNFYNIGGEINLETMLTDTLSNVSNARYKVRKVSANGCTVSSVFSSNFTTMTNTSGDTWQDTVGFDTEQVPSDGEYTILFETSDELGNKTTKYFDILVDNTAPVTGFAGLTTFDTTPVVSGSVDDDSATVDVVINGQPYVAAVSGGTWTVNVALPLAVGTYDVYVTGTDGVGNSDVNNFPASLEIQAVLGTSTGSGGSSAGGSGSSGSSSGSTSSSRRVGSPVNTVAVNTSTGIGGEGSDNGQNVAQSNSATDGEETDDDEQEPEVLQATDDNTASETAGSSDEDGSEEDACFKVFGVCWYWWIPVGLVVGYIVYRIARKDEE